MLFMVIGSTTNEYIINWFEGVPTLDNLLLLVSLMWNLCGNNYKALCIPKNDEKLWCPHVG